MKRLEWGYTDDTSDNYSGYWEASHGDFKLRIQRWIGIIGRPYEWSVCILANEDGRWGHTIMASGKADTERTAKSQARQALIGILEQSKKQPAEPNT